MTKYTGKIVAEFNFEVTKAEVDAWLKKKGRTIESENELKELLTDHIVKGFMWDDYGIVNFKQVEEE